MFGHTVWQKKVGILEHVVVKQWPYPGRWRSIDSSGTVCEGVRVQDNGKAIRKGSQVRFLNSHISEMQIFTSAT